ncbi:BCCT family transporter [uncultured Shewanella sp.]|uniref:BCCT family transporter n=1 Tax=uncultured Shewanella sp. TaxID=173975 RepID=UPI00261875A9|nr:BCCT family transporter [uncultured Shewanella sp.]
MIKTTLTKNLDYLAIGLSLLVVLSVSVFFLTDTHAAIQVANNTFKLIAYNFDTPILWYAFALVIIAIFFIFSKYGHIRMGQEKPEFSTFAYITMMALAGVGSGTIYWAFLEWSYYIKTPPFDILPHSVKAKEWAVTYSLHHWGLTAWAIYAVTAIPVMYSFYILKNHSLKLSDIVMQMIKHPVIAKITRRFIDILYPIAIMFSLIIVLSLGIPIITAAIALLTDINDTLALKLSMIAIVTVLLTLSSFLGIKKGMQTVSQTGTYFVIALALYLLFFGPTQFILENTSSSFALWGQNFLKMSLYTDAIKQAKFPQSWTVYFWAYWIIFIPLMCVFVTKVSKGRTLREVMICMIGGGTAGTASLFAIIGSFMMKTELDGKVAISQLVEQGQGSQAIASALSTLPLSSLILVIFIIATFLLLVTTMDGSVFAVACNTQKTLDKHADPAISLKIFWSLVIVAIPTIFVSVNAPVSSMQSAILIFVLPLIALTSFMLYKTIGYIREDYGHLSTYEIQQRHALTPNTSNETILNIQYIHPLHIQNTKHKTQTIIID